MPDDPRAYILVAVITVVGTLLTSWAKNKLDKRGQELDANNANTDQLQENLAALQTEVKDLRERVDLVENREQKIRAEAHRVVDEARSLYYAVDEEVFNIRKGITEGTIPPLPSRPTRNPFPVLAFHSNT